MGLKLTPSGLSDELRIGKLKRDTYLTNYEQDIATYATPGFKTGWSQYSTAPENHSFEWVALNLSKLVVGIPRCRVSTTRPGEPELQAKALTFALNHWARLTRLREKLERFGVDMALRYAVALVTSEPQPGYVESEDPPYWPSVTRLSLKRFCADPTALEPEQWQWAAHLTIRNRSDVIEAAKSGKEKGWNLGKLQSMTEQDLKEYRSNDLSQRVQRDEVAYWEVWVPGEPAEGDTEDGFHGRIFTVLDGEESKQDEDWLREPRDFFGPMSGPYVFTGAYPVPDEAIPLAPLVATRGQAEYLNRIKRATVLAVETYKNLLLVRSSDNTLAQKIQNAPNDTVHTYEGEDVREAAASFEIGGLQQQHLVAGEDARQTLDRVSGMFDADRGNVTGDATATENAIAGQAASTRSGFLTTKFLEFVARLFFTAGYYFDRDEDVELDLPAEAAGVFMDEAGNVIERPKVKGGGSNGEDFNRLDLTIDVGSMTRTVEAAGQEKLFHLDRVMQNVLLMAPAAAYTNVRKYLEVEADVTGIPEIEQLFNTDLMAQVSMMMIAAGAQPQGQQGGQKSPQPRVGSELRGAGGKAARKPTPLEQSTGPAKTTQRPGGKASQRALPVRSS